MHVRLTGLSGKDVAVDGAMADPPCVGKPFSVLIMMHEKLVVTGNVAVVGFDWFMTECGARYSWARLVGDA